jgi:mono/diheme cytochrome c family protein
MDNIITLRLGRTEWEGLVNDMISRGAPAFDNDHELIINYLATNFGPNSRVPESIAAEEVLRTGVGSPAAAEGPGKQLMDANCAQCHALTFVTNARHTRDEWRAIVDDMISRGASLDGDEVDVVVQYLADAYGPAGSSGVTAAATPSQGQQSSDDEGGPSGLPDGPGRELVATVCTQCHGLNNVVTLRLTAEEWEGLVNDMISRGAPAFDDQYKVITQYLSTNFGKGN